MNLRSELPFWLLRNGLTANYPALEGDAKCDALVVGGGISGALLTHELASRGIDVLLVDRRHAAFGSTSASTGLLQYEIDTPLHELIGKVGEQHARRAYLLGVEAIRNLAKAAGKDCAFAKRQSFMLAKNKGHIPVLRREFEARKAAGLQVGWVTEDELREKHGLMRPAAIRSAVAAEMDPYKITHRLLHRAIRKGARVFDRTALCDFGKNVAMTGRGGRIRFRKIFFATGYEVRELLSSHPMEISSTYAYVTEPMPDLDWWPSRRALLWESGEAYLYARTTDDNRILVGGADDEVQNGDRRDARVEAKSRLLHRAFHKLLPSAPETEIAFAWAGAFGHTKDGLPYIGEHAKYPNGYFALGFGGNGITFSMMASKILADLFEGKKNEDATLFRFDR